MRVLLTGSGSFGAAVADSLSEVAVLVGVVSPGLHRGDYLRQDRLRTWADRSRIPWVDAEGWGVAAMEPVGKVDLIVAAHSHAYVSRKARNAATEGAIGYHPSLLPRHKGRDAVRWTVHMGDPVAGGTVYWLTDNIDGGPVESQDWCFVEPGWDASALWRKELFPMGVRLLTEAVVRIANGEIRMRPQREGVETWEPSWERPPVHRPDLWELPAATHQL